MGLLAQERYDSLTAGQDKIFNKAQRSVDATRYQGGKTRDTVRNQATKTRDTVKNQSGFIQANTTAEAQATRDTVNSGFAGTNQQITNSQKAVQGTVASQADQTRKQMAGGFAGISDGQQQLFDQTGQGFANTGEQIAGVSDQVAGGFADMNQDFGKTWQNQNQLNQNMQGGFTSISDLAKAGFAGAAEELAAARASILAGQGNLNTALTNTQKRLDQWGGGLADGQAAIQDTVGGVQSGLNSFTDTYTRDAALATKARTEMQKQLTGGFDQVRQDVGKVNDAQSQGQQALMQAVGGVTQATQRSQQQAQQGFSNMEAGFAAQQQAQQAAQQQAQGQQAELATGVNRVRNLLQTTGQNLDQNTRSQFSALSASFDENGQLIQSSVDQNGDLLSRQIDEQGNLLINRFDATGQLLGQATLNVEQTLAYASQVENQLRSVQYGSNALMGGLTPAINARQAAAVPVAGMMSPYSRTR